MSASLNLVTVADSYTAACTLQDQWGARGGSFVIANASVFVQLQYGGNGSGFWTDEFMVPPQGGPIDARATGIRFRNYTAGTAAIVTAALFRGPERGVKITGTWSGTLNANGTLS